MTTWFTTTQSPIGELLLVNRGAGLAGVYMEEHARGPRPDVTWIEDAARFQRERRQLQEYFTGARERFELELGPEGTPFQRRVWSELEAIPYGETATYEEIAARMGHPGSARAVGTANARNPISIVVPCHRVIAKGGALTGYAGGLERKRWLLDLETTQHRAAAS